MGTLDLLAPYSAASQITSSALKLSFLVPNECFQEKILSAKCGHSIEPATSMSDDPASCHHGHKRPHSSSIQSLDVARSRLRQLLSTDPSHCSSQDVCSFNPAVTSHCPAQDVSSLFSTVSITCDLSMDRESCHLKETSTTPILKSVISPLSHLSGFYEQLTPELCGPEHLLPHQTDELEFGIRQLSLTQVASVYNWYFSTGLPETNAMFPWLHGLHHRNKAQRKFFDRGGQSFAKPNLARFLMAVLVDKSLNCVTLGGENESESPPILKNTISLSDVLEPIHVSRAEVRQQVENAFKTAFPDRQIDPVWFDTLALDADAVKCLPTFRDLDPERGVSLRNFHIQVAKCAKCADFMVYSHTGQSHKFKSVLRLLWLAQRLESALLNAAPSQYSVFSVVEPVSNSSRLAPVLVKQLLWTDDYATKERMELMRMSSASKLDHNVWVGNTFDYQQSRSYHIKAHDLQPSKSTLSYADLSFMSDTIPPAHWRLFVHCKGGAPFPTAARLEALLDEYYLAGRTLKEAGPDRIVVDFPASGSVGMGDCRPENLLAIVNTCKVIYLHLCASGSSDKVVSTLLYCTDGYTETLLLVLCYLMYVNDRSLEECMLALHLEHNRPFYLFESDVVVLGKLEFLLRKFSPARPGNDIVWNQLETASGAELSDMLLAPGLGHAPAPHRRLGYIEQNDDECLARAKVLPETNWVKETQGSLPLRILPHLYLGLIKHANCLSLLTKLGISKVISVGEQLDWLRTMDESHIDVTEDGDIEMLNIKNCPVDAVMRVRNLRDDGKDGLFRSLPQILDYINKEHIRSDGQARILVHCWVGVSRLATVAIAEVMRRLHVALPEAYLYVRARRLNIIIQPNLRFMYELMKWDEHERVKEYDREHKVNKEAVLDNEAAWDREAALGQESLDKEADNLGKREEDQDDKACKERGPIDTKEPRYGQLLKPIRNMDWFMLCREITLLNKPFNS